MANRKEQERAAEDDNLNEPWKPFLKISGLQLKERIVKLILGASLMIWIMINLILPMPIP